VQVSHNQVLAHSALLRAVVAVRRHCKDQQRLPSHEGQLLPSGLLAGRDRRPVRAGWLER
jgi:hypothetical protein